MSDQPKSLEIFPGVIVCKRGSRLLEWLSGPYRACSHMRKMPITVSRDRIWRRECEPRHIKRKVGMMYGMLLLLLRKAIRNGQAARTGSTGREDFVSARHDPRFWP
jgi:hypothetical protein